MTQSFFNVAKAVGKAFGSKRTGGLVKSFLNVSKAVDDAFGSRQQAKAETLSQRLARQNEAVNRQTVAVDRLQSEYDKLLSGDAEPRSLTAMEKALNRNEREAEKLIAQFEELFARQQHLQEVSRWDMEARGIVNPGTTAELKSIDAEMEVLGGRIRSTEGVSEKLRQSMKQIQLDPSTSEEAQKLQTEIGLGAEKLERLRNEASVTGEQINSAASESSTSLDGVGAAAGAAAGGTASAFLAAGSAIVSVFGKVASGAKSAMESAKKMAEETAKKITAPIEKVRDLIQKTIKRVANLVLAALIFNVIRRQLTKFRDYIELALRDNKAFANSFGQVKANLMTAFQPVIDFIIPILTRLTQWLSLATQYVVMFMSALSGKSVKAMQDSAKNMDKLAQSTSNAGSAAKKVLAPFDEINQLAQNTASANEAASDAFAPQYTDMEDLDPTPFQRFVEKLKELVPDIEYFYNLGYNIGQKITDGLERIDWNYIKQWAASLAIKLATFLNGAVDGIKWETVGKTIGEGINTFLTFVVTSLTTFDWLNFGRKIGAALNSMIETIKWDDVGRYFSSRFNMILNFLYGIVTTFKWRDLGRSIGTAINTFFKDIDWATVGQTVSEGIKGALSALGAALEEVDWKAIGEDIGTFLANLDWEGIFDEVVAAIGTAFNGLHEFLTGLLGEEATNTLLGVGAALMLWVSPLKFLLSPLSLVGAALILLGENWDIVKEKAQKAWDKIVEAWNNASAWFNEKVVTPIVNFFNTLFEPVSSVFTRMRDGVKETWSKVSAWFDQNVIQPILTVFNPIKEKISEIFNKTWEIITAVFRAAGNWFNQNVIQPITDVFSPIIEKLGGFFRNAWTEIKNAFSSAASWFSNVFNDVWKKIEEAFAPVTEFFNSLWDDVVSIFSEVGTAVGEAVSGAFKSVVNTIVGFVENVINGFIREINNVISLVNGIPIIGANIAPIELLRVPRLARGGVIPPNNPRAVIVGDNTREEEIVSPVSTMKQAFMEAFEELGDLGALGGGGIHIHAEGTMGELIRLLRLELIKENNRAGYRIQPQGGVT